MAAGVVVPSASADQIVGGKKVQGQIETTYFSLSGPAGLGEPVTEELTDRRGGRFQAYKLDSSIYWSPGLAPLNNAFQVGGAIRARWGQKNWEVGALGYPISDELRITETFTFPGVKIPIALGHRVTGAWNDFQGGAIMWSPSTGAQIVWGKIREEFLRNGGPSKYGWPVAEEQRTATGWSQQFEKATITYPPTPSPAQ